MANCTVCSDKAVAAIPHFVCALHLVQQSMDDLEEGDPLRERLVVLEERLLKQQKGNSVGQTSSDENGNVSVTTETEDTKTTTEVPTGSAEPDTTTPDQGDSEPGQVDQPESNDSEGEGSNTNN